MFFQLQLNQFLPPLSILVGEGGLMYVKLVDLGVLLRKSNPYTYRNMMKHLAVQGKDVLFTAGFKIPPKTLTSHYVPIMLAYKLILSELPDIAKLFMKQFREGVAHKLRMRKFVGHERKAPLLLCTEINDDKCVSVPLWIEQFVIDLERYRQEVRNNPTSSSSKEFVKRAASASNMDHFKKLKLDQPSTSAETGRESEPGPSNKKTTYIPLIDLEPPENSMETCEQVSEQGQSETFQEPLLRFIKQEPFQEPPVESISQDITQEPPMEHVSQDTIQESRVEHVTEEIIQESPVGHVTEDTIQESPVGHVTEDITHDPPVEPISQDTIQEPPVEPISQDTIQEPPVELATETVPNASSSRETPERVPIFYINLKNSSPQLSNGSFLEPGDLIVKIHTRPSRVYFAHADHDAMYWVNNFKRP